MEWTEDSRHQGKCISVPEDVYEQGCVKDVDEGLQVVADVQGLRGHHLIQASLCPGVGLVLPLKGSVCPFPPGSRKNRISFDDQSL